MADHDVEQLFRLAVRESDCPASDRPEEYAAIRVMGCIGLFADTREQFVEAGLHYHQIFDDYADEALRHLGEEINAAGERGSGDIDKLKAQIDCIKSFSRIAESVTPQCLKERLEHDWDERIDEAEGSMTAP